MKVLKNVMQILKHCSFGDIVKFVLIALLFIFVAVLLFKLFLILFLVGVLFKLIAPYFGFRFPGMRFKHNSEPRYKVVGEEEQRQEKKTTK